MGAAEEIDPRDAEVLARLREEDPWERGRRAAESGEHEVRICAWCRTRPALPGWLHCGEFCECADDITRTFEEGGDG